MSLREVRSSVYDRSRSSVCGPGRDFAGASAARRCSRHLLKWWVFVRVLVLKLRWRRREIYRAAGERDRAAQSKDVRRRRESLCAARARRARWSETKFRRANKACRRSRTPAGSRRLRSNRARAESGERRAQLMACADPAVDDAGVLAAERLAGQPHRRRHGRDPVEPVEHREQAEARSAAVERRTAGRAATARATCSSRRADGGSNSDR